VTYSCRDYLSASKKIVDKHGLQRYVDILLDYWEQNPATLGYGFGHVLEVAVEAYEIGEMNDYDKPEHLFIDGLFHDIYRPVESKDGEEEHGATELRLSSFFFRRNNITKEIT